MALRYDHIESALKEYLDPVLSTRRTVEEPARGLLQLSGEQQEFSLHWTNVIRKSNSEMAFQFVSKVPQALAQIGIDGTRQWLLAAMDVYDKEGLYPGSAALGDLQTFSDNYRQNHIVVHLEDVKNILETFITGLEGRTLKIEPGNTWYTDTNTLFLPRLIKRFDSQEANYLLYKAIAVQLWAQNRFGTFRRISPESPHLRQQLAAFADSARALRLFNLLESERLKACIERELPGLGRELGALQPRPTFQDATWQYFIEQLRQPDANVESSLIATRALFNLDLPWPQALPWQGDFDLDAARTGIEERLATEKNALQQALAELLARTIDENAGQAEDNNEMNLELLRDENGEFTSELLLDGEPVETGTEIENLLESMLQDLQQIPGDWLDSNGIIQSPTTEAEVHADDVRQGNNLESDAMLYHEWDFRRQTYRRDWCVLRQMATQPLDDDFYPQTLERYHHLVAEIRRHFEALRGQDRRLKGEPVGDNIDFDALITALADKHNGVEITDRLFTRKLKIDRDLAVVFMVDASGSTKGWINQAERESLILLCEALEVLGDRYAIYGFSGMTRNRCEIYPVKTFEQKYDKHVRARISGLRPRDYTRMGVIIRHLSKLLNGVEAKTRLLITLSDGKPDDYDGYRGEYGIEDTRRALQEARHFRIHPFCITIDTEASDYLPHMYGEAGYVLVDDVRKLPLKVADIYRKLTT